ncbi:primary-amine oxidase [Capillimicrobium parvum]|uniref:Amine oxidase n=1 Tax=Capillimicrobium parvum TaxID=2884022 RepID=A0A9E6XUQ6_9ACTN|nr:primary-amine oxidase [Capillimicrobium parvum]UGS34540.1 Primary amine oxidase [Capillimicrobium parvum]
MNPIETPITAAVHPLEPLSAEEIARATGTLRTERDLGPSWRFVFVLLHEPRRAAADWSSGESVPREAFVVLRDRESRGTYEALVSLTDDRVVWFQRKSGVQAQITFEEFMQCEQVVRSDPRWQEAMRARGVEDFSLCMIDPWAASHTMPDDHPDERRILRPLTWVQSEPGDNGYARPVEGLICVVDCDAMAVVEVIDHGIVPFPPRAGNYVPDLMTRAGNVPAFTALRDDVRPIEITQPEGASFTVDGHAVSWQKWRVRISFNAKEGLVLHDIGYEDGGRVRPIISRASLSEMYVPYGDPAPTHAFKNVFDMGEYGLGWLANPLTLGCDCLGEIRYFDGVVNDQDGQPVTIPNAVCMHEEDAGIGWKHTNFHTEEVEVRRLRRLVISTIVTVGNYEYGYFWYLYTDGTIEYEVKLTGVISTGAVAPGQRPRHGTLVAPGLYGPHHQHFFCVRLDMAVDGVQNTVVEVDSEPLPPGPDNPLGTAWVTKRTELRTESEAQRIIDPLRARTWRIENPNVRNTVGDPVAYNLIPGENVLPMAEADSVQGRRAGFAAKHLWVTPYAEGERFAAGDYPNQHPGGSGLPEFTAADRPVADTDLVVWYTFGAHHVVRPEDWPVMPATHIGFRLKPSGFFDGNPALDMPRSAAHHCHG